MGNTGQFVFSCVLPQYIELEAKKIKENIISSKLNLLFRLKRFPIMKQIVLLTSWYILSLNHIPKHSINLVTFFMTFAFIKEKQGRNFDKFNNKCCNKVSKSWRWMSHNFMKENRQNLQCSFSQKQHKNNYGLQ